MSSMPSSPRVLITGSRHYADEAIIRRELSAFPPGTVVIHGGASGADSLADRVAKQLGFEVVAVPADWKKHGKAAGPLRNQKMLDEQSPTIVLAFPLEDSRGTWDMVQRARDAGVEVRVVPDQELAR